MWFNFAPFANTIAEQLGLTDAEEKTIALCNVALTIPARIFIGMALDRWGPRRVYAAILMFAVIPNTVFALSSSMTTLVFSRLALSVVGAGFVVGIRMVSEWFPPERGRHRRGRVRRVGQLRCGGRRVLAADGRRAVRRRRRLALVDPAHRRDRRRLRRVLPAGRHRHARRACRTSGRAARARSR